ncbi:putative immune-type receptor 13 isoform 1 precursor [Silurus meridionalis]|nr:putative immune-type receptor 13 isoform 1 precursor [Silurus meridionalis]
MRADSFETKSIKQTNLVISAVGDNVILHCFRGQKENTDSIIWYKQKVGHQPCVMVSVQSNPAFEDEFKSPKFSIEKEEKGCHLKIADVEPSDEAMYYCGYIQFITRFTNGTFLSVKGKPDFSVSVRQESVSDSVPAGASVTLQCSVLSESRAAELQVLWFRAAPSQSHPQLIYTHHNSSLQCESESSTHTCVYNLSKNIFSLDDTGTYYCAVVLCGKIIFGNGTRVQLERPVDPVMICLTVALGVCVFMIFAQAVWCKPADCGIVEINHINQPNPMIIADVGDSVTLNCYRLQAKTSGAIVWYKQKIGHEPRVIVTVQSEPSYENEFKSPRFSIENKETSCHLKIAHLEASDEAMYYCGLLQFFTTFGNGTFLSVKVTLKHDFIADPTLDQDSDIVEGSLQQIICIHSPLSSTSVSFKPTTCMSSLTTSINLLLGLPLFLLPGGSILSILLLIYPMSLL